MSDALKVAVVTGGGHGIGRALSRRLAKDGLHVAVADLDQAAAERVAVEIGGSAYRVDVGEEADIRALVNEIESSIGPIDVFISNAGVGFGDGESGPASADGGMVPTPERWDLSWRVNVMAHVYAARYVIPGMLERGHGYIVNVASAAGLLCQIGDAAYTATKHAAVGFADSLAISYPELNVSVVCPQAVATRMIGIEDDSDSLDGGFMGNDVDDVLSADDAANRIVDAIRAGKFLILTHPEVHEYTKRRAGDHDRWIAGMQRFRQSLLEKKQ